MKERQHNIIINGMINQKNMPKSNLTSLCQLLLQEVLEHIEKKSNSPNLNGAESNALQKAKGSALCYTSL